MRSCGRTAEHDHQPPSPCKCTAIVQVLAFRKVLLDVLTEKLGKSFHKDMYEARQVNQRAFQDPLNQDRPIQKRTQGEFLQFFFPSPSAALQLSEAAVLLSATVVQNMHFHLNAPSFLKCLILMAASVVKSPTIFIVALFVDGSSVSVPPAAAY